MSTGGRPPRKLKVQRMNIEVVLFYSVRSASVVAITPADASLKPYHKPLRFFKEQDIRKSFMPAKYPELCLEARIPDKNLQFWNFDSSDWSDITKDTELDVCLYRKRYIIVRVKDMPCRDFHLVLNKADHNEEPVLRSGVTVLR